MKKFRRNVNKKKFVSRLHFIYKFKKAPKHYNRRDVINGFVARGVFKRGTFSDKSFKFGFLSKHFGKNQYFRKSRFKYNSKRNWRSFKPYKFKLIASYSLFNENFKTNFDKNYLMSSKFISGFNYINLDVTKLLILSYVLSEKVNQKTLDMVISKDISCSKYKWLKFLTKTNSNYIVNRNSLPKEISTVFEKEKYNNNKLFTIKDSRERRKLTSTHKLLWRLYFFLNSSARVLRLGKKGVNITKRFRKKMRKKVIRRAPFMLRKVLRKVNKFDTAVINYCNWSGLGFDKRNRKRMHIWRRSKFKSKLRFRRRRGYYRKLRINRFKWWGLLSERTTAPHKKMVLRKIKGSKKFRRYSWNKNFNASLVRFKKQFRGLFCYNMLTRKRVRGNKNFTSIENLAKLKTIKVSKFKQLRTNSLNVYYLFLLKRPYLLSIFNFNKSKGGLATNTSNKKGLLFKTNPDVLLNFYLIKFIENKTNRLVYLNVNNNHLSKTKADSSYMVIANWASNVYKFDRRFGYKVPLFNFCLVLYHAFKNKDLELLATLIEFNLSRLKLWQHRSFFKFIMFLVESYVSTMFKNFKITGFQFEVKGKISLGGNSRKKKLSLRLRNTFKSNMKVRSKYKFKPLKTVSGALGVKMWVYYV